MRSVFAMVLMGLALPAVAFAQQYGICEATNGLKIEITNVHNRGTNPAVFVYSRPDVGDGFQVVDRYDLVGPGLPGKSGAYVFQSDRSERTPVTLTTFEPLMETLDANSSQRSGVPSRLKIGTRTFVFTCDVQWRYPDSPN